MSVPVLIQFTQWDSGTWCV